MRAETETEKTPRELAEEARDALSDSKRRGALALDRGRLADAVALVLRYDRLTDEQDGDVLFELPSCSSWFAKAHLCHLLAAETAERGRTDFAAEWESDAAEYEAIGHECMGGVVLD